MKKKVLKLKKKNSVLFLILIITLISAAKIVKYFNSNNYKLQKIGYNKSEINLINKNVNFLASDSLIFKKYNKYVIRLLSDKLYKEKNLNYYIQAFEFYNGEYDSNILKIINDKYFKVANLKRYIDYYRDNKGLLSRSIVENINCNLDNDYYTVDNDSDISKNFLILVNKYNKLNENYAPKDLVKIDKKYGYEKQINKTVYAEFKKMYDDMAKENLHIIIVSPYRSYNEQKKLYNNYVRTNGKEKAESFSAKAGYSEHQTGLAMDISSKTKPYTEFVDTKEYVWMNENCNKYGFILRYPEGKEMQTGYMFESWHYRYVGKEVARYIYENNITFDEYYEYFIK